MSIKDNRVSSQNQIRLPRYFCMARKHNEQNRKGSEMKIEITQPDMCLFRGKKDLTGFCNITGNVCEAHENKYPGDCPILDDDVTVTRIPFESKVEGE